MIGNIHLCSLYVLISHVNTSKNECMESRSLWNNILGSRDVGDARGEGIMPGLAGMQQGCRQLDTLSCGEREEVLVFLPSILSLLSFLGDWLPPAFLMENFPLSGALSPCFNLHQSDVKVAQRLLTKSPKWFLLLKVGKERRSQR